MWCLAAHLICLHGPTGHTLGGASEPGYSLWSSLFQRCISLMTMGLLKSTSWKPVTLAPPCMKRSRLMSLKPFRGNRRREWSWSESRDEHKLQNVQWFTFLSVVAVTVFVVKYVMVSKCYFVLILIITKAVGWDRMKCSMKQIHGNFHRWKKKNPLPDGEAINFFLIRPRGYWHWLFMQDMCRLSCFTPCDRWRRKDE